jgi:ABC-type branched-subunit amino acid transport system ATPase component
MSNLALEVRNVEAGYDGRIVLHEFSMTVERSEIVALIGPNGAGKSTALKAIFGAVRCLRGSVRVFGEDLGNRRPSEMNRRGVSYIPQGGRVFAALTVHENLLIGANAAADRGRATREIEVAYDLFAALRNRVNVVAGLLSAGERQMVALARGFIIGRSLLLIDEPTGGLAPALAQTVLTSLEAMRKGGERTLVIVEQNTSYALGASDRVYGMNLGHVHIRGVPASSVTAESLRDLYI